MILDRLPEVQAAILPNLDIETDDIERKLPGIKDTTISSHFSANWCWKKDEMFKAIGFNFLEKTYTEYGAMIFSQHGS